MRRCACGWGPSRRARARSPPLRTRLPHGKCSDGWSAPPPPRVCCAVFHKDRMLEDVSRKKCPDATARVADGSSLMLDDDALRDRACPTSAKFGPMSAPESFIATKFGSAKSELRPRGRRNGHDLGVFVEHRRVTKFGHLRIWAWSDRARSTSFGSVREQRRRCLTKFGGFRPNLDQCQPTLRYARPNLSGFEQLGAYFSQLRPILDQDWPTSSLGNDQPHLVGLGRFRPCWG